MPIGRAAVHTELDEELVKPGSSQQHNTDVARISEEMYIVK